MSSQLAYVTVQAALITASSNILAQVISAYRSGSAFTIDWTPVFQFAFYTLVTCPPNYIWQEYIESLLPGQTLTPSPAGVEAASTSSAEKLSHPPPSSSPLVETHLNVPNTIAKLLIDQSLCASVNTVAFIIAMAYFQGSNTTEAVQTVREDFWPILKAGWKLWPVVSLTNYAVVKDVQTRTLIGNLAGVGWNVYLSLVAGGK